MLLDIKITEVTKIGQTIKGVYYVTYRLLDNKKGCSFVKKANLYRLIKEIAGKFCDLDCPAVNTRYFDAAELSLSLELTSGDRYSCVIINKTRFLQAVAAKNNSWIEVRDSGFEPRRAKQAKQAKQESEQQWLVDWGYSLAVCEDGAEIDAINQLHKEKFGDRYESQKQAMWQLLPLDIKLHIKRTVSVPAF